MASAKAAGAFLGKVIPDAFDYPVWVRARELAA
jgi:hypothetical protein